MDGACGVRMSEWLETCFSLQFRVLTFRATADELFNLGWKHVPFGLFWALLAGIGRAWDNPNANIIFRSGAPSVLYVFVLSIFLWLFIAPLRPERWRISRVIAFVSLTALPGVLYAVPFEMITSPDDAIVANGILLLIVASWRVALLSFFLWKSKLSVWGTATAVCLPLSIIILGLVMTDRLEKTVAVMGGFRYFVVENETLAKPYLDEQNKKPNFSAGTYDKIQTRGAQGKHTVYREFSHGAANNTMRTDVPPGMREIGWDDPEYMPPTPVIAVARALNMASTFAAPIFGVVYVTICCKNLVQFVRERIKKKRNSVTLTADQSNETPDSDSPLP